MDFAGTTTHYSEVELSMLLEALIFFSLEMICSCSQSKASMKDADLPTPGFDWNQFRTA
jgi:hypothetical protein